MDSALLDEAVKQAVASENPATHNMMEFLATTFGATNRSTRRSAPSRIAARPAA